MLASKIAQRLPLVIHLPRLPAAELPVQSTKPAVPPREMQIEKPLRPLHVLRNKQNSSNPASSTCAHKSPFSLGQQPARGISFVCKPQQPGVMGHSQVWLSAREQIKTGLPKVLGIYKGVYAGQCGDPTFDATVCSSSKVEIDLGELTDDELEGLQKFMGGYNWKHAIFDVTGQDGDNCTLFAFKLLRDLGFDYEKNSYPLRPSEMIRLTLDVHAKLVAKGERKVGAVTPPDYVPNNSKEYLEFPPDADQN